MHMQPNPDPSGNLSAEIETRRLVVIVPGMGSKLHLWESLLERLKKEDGYRQSEADWLSFDHKINYASLGRVEDLSRRLRNQIDGEWKEHKGYRDIVLVGHSFGGLIARRVYLLAAGAVPGEAASPWGSRVSRIVLFASVNRGFNLNRLNWAVNILAWMARAFSRRIFCFEDILQGSDFVTNLRIDWIRHFHAVQDQESETEESSNTKLMRTPLVVQFLGDQDGALSREDSKDVLAFPNGHYIEIADANHENLFRLDIALDPDARYAVVRDAFVEEPAKMVTDPALRPIRPPVRRIVFILHGIRASNVDAWIDGLKSRLRVQDPVHTHVVAPTYGYFSALRFGLPMVRRGNIPIFADAYTEQLAQHPEAEFNIIAHSNGSYMLGHCLSRIPGMKFQNVVLAGSALPPSYDWKTLMRNDVGNARQIGRVMNERADADWPIGLLSSALRGLGMRDIGPAGFAGFLGSSTFEIAYHKGGHGQALIPKNHGRLIDFVLGVEPPEPPSLVEEPYLFGWLSRLAPYFIWIILILLIWGVWLYIFSGGAFHLSRAIGIFIALIVALMLLDTV